MVVYEFTRIYLCLYVCIHKNTYKAKIQNCYKEKQTKFQYKTAHTYTCIYINTYAYSTYLYTYIFMHVCMFVCKCAAEPSFLYTVRSSRLTATAQTNTAIKDRNATRTQAKETRKA